MPSTRQIGTALATVAVSRRRLAPSTTHCGRFHGFIAAPTHIAAADTPTATIARRNPSSVASLSSYAPCIKSSSSQNTKPKATKFSALVAATEPLTILSTGIATRKAASTTDGTTNAPCGAGLAGNSITVDT